MHTKLSEGGLILLSYAKAASRTGEVEVQETCANDIASMEIGVYGLKPSCGS